MRLAGAIQGSETGQDVTLHEGENVSVNLAATPF